MYVLPAIDIRGGKVVRLTRGDYGQEERYEITPLRAAMEFKECGAEYLHVVDLDGAKDGKLQNFDIIRDIVETTGLFVEVGGGIRNYDSIAAYIEAGVQRVILGTVATNNLPFLRDMLKEFDDKIALGIDAKDGYVCVDGWQTQTKIVAEEHCKRAGPMGVKTVVYTDIGRDGMLEGPSFDLYAELQERFPALRIIVSGGVSCLDDIRRADAMGFAGIIVGKAIYENHITLKDLALCLQNGSFPA